MSVQCPDQPPLSRVLLKHYLKATDPVPDRGKVPANCPNLTNWGIDPGHKYVCR
jgi:hypothetical protein